MWTCPECKQQFLHTNQSHSCNDKTLDDFLKGKSAHTLELYHYFIDQYKTIGKFVLHPAKSRIGLATQTRFCSINQLGKDFIHIVLTFHEPYYDNYCFIKIGQIPGSNSYNHHCRIYHKEDITDELMTFMKMAYEKGQRSIK